MTVQAPDRFWSGIDIPKTIAGVLAAVSAAVLGSFLGVAGTLAGAAVASVVGSIGTELYHRFIARGSKKIKQTFVTAPAAVGTPPVAAAADEVPSDEPAEIDAPATTQVTATATAPKPSVRLRWGRVAAVAGAVFVLAMGSLTAFELLTKQTVADAVGADTGGGTTVGNVLTGTSKDTEVPATTPSGAPSETAGTEPTEAPTTGPADTTEEPTDQTTTEPDPAETGTAPVDPAPTGEPTGETQQPGAADQPGDGAPADGQG
jgi:hypothetical protein